MQALFALLSLGFGCLGIVPLLLAVAALIDAVRVGADWYWYMIILAFPGLGSIAYFVVVRSPLLGARNAAAMSPKAARRLQARRRLRELQVQLANWRGPGILTEAGEELTALGKPKEAEKLLREAKENGAAVEDYAFPLAVALEMQGRWAEAVPLLQALVAVEPDSRLGEGPLHLARSLDEAGRPAEAEPVLRKLLDKRTVIEAQVRLARILLARGEREEAGRLTAEVLNDAKGLPGYLKRRHRAWIRAAGRLKTGAEKLPRPGFEGDRPPLLRTALIVAAALLAVLMLAAYAATLYLGTREAPGDDRQRADNARLRDELERIHPWSRGGDLAAVDLSSADIDRYLRLRGDLGPAVREVAAEHARIRTRPSGYLEILEVQEKTDRWLRAQARFEAVFLGALQKEGMGPGEAGKLAEMIEWRFLRRPQALAFAIPDYDRQDWLTSRLALQGGGYEAAIDGAGEDEAARERRRMQERTEAKLAAIEGRAGADTRLSPATRSLLEGRRAELERLDPAADEALLHALDPSLPWW